MQLNIVLFQDSGGKTIEYWICGLPGGHPVLFMHGATPMPFSAGLVAEIERHNLCVYTILRPGYGQSTRIRYKNVYAYAALLGGFIESLHIGCFDVMGLSAGSPYCYALAAAYPERVRKISICAGIPLANNRHIFRMNPLRDRVFFSLSRHIPAVVVGKFAVRTLESMERKKGWQPAVWGEDMDTVFEKYVRPNWPGFGWSTHVQYRDWGFDVAKTSCEVHIYHSRTDEMIPLQIVCESAKLLPNSRVFILDDENHASEKTLRVAVENIREKTGYFGV
ncbi:MAG: alpha/beta hydrolase [Treponema sp.]|jgi:pimeloyl-ACP methyl ester carboxylesterase|nr:alpha/beta hydrolase [Treponema sp.]